MYGTRSETKVHVFVILFTFDLVRFGLTLQFMDLNKSFSIIYIRPVACGLHVLYLYFTLIGWLFEMCQMNAPSCSHIILSEAKTASNPANIPSPLPPMLFYGPFFLLLLLLFSSSIVKRCLNF